MKKGFTLLEMIVVIGIFSLFSGAILGIFISSVNSQKRILAQQEILDQANYLLEYISRSLRMARKDDLSGTNCLNGEKVNYEISRAGQGIKFQNYKKQCQEFYLDGNRIKENRQGIEDFITPSSLKINSLKFNISGETQNDNLQPKVTILLEMEGSGRNPPKIRIQTSVSQRNLDVAY